MVRFIACVSLLVAELLKVFPEEFPRMKYNQVCDKIAADMDAYLRKVFENVVQLDELRDGKELAIAFEFESPSGDLIFQIPVYIGGSLDLRPYSSNFSLAEMKKLR